MRGFLRSIVLLLLLTSPALAGGAFFHAIDDLPLMPGLQEQPDAAVTFDQPEGRIVEAEATGALDPAAVRDFYRQTLPQLGWRLAGPDAFSREGERLSFRFSPGARGLIVHVTVEPHA